jgi:hypothetical protein
MVNLFLFFVLFVVIRVIIKIISYLFIEKIWLKKGNLIMSFEKRFDKDIYYYKIIHEFLNEHKELDIKYVLYVPFFKKPHKIFLEYKNKKNKISEADFNQINKNLEWVNSIITKN